jgi:SAM-dependent methyltransferase
MELSPVRPCPVCDGIGSRPLYKQRFAALSWGTSLHGYDVVLCETCGAGFAQGVPSQDDLDAYYRDMSKYENPERGGSPSLQDIARFRAIAGMIAPFVPATDARVLEVGCATGGLLHELKRLGFGRAMGLDPSPACALQARALHGVDVRTGTLSERPGNLGTFDVVILLGVLEHFRDTGPALEALRGLLGPRGRLFVEVPDVAGFARFLDAPFQQFSLEHLTFFSEISLASLLKRFGFSPLLGVSGARPHSLSSTMPVLSVIAEKGAISAGVLPRDEVTGPALSSYVESSFALERTVRRAIDRLVESRQPVIVWGVGTHTAHLLAACGLGAARIVAFVDSNPRYHGKTLNGVAIESPEWLKDRPEAVVVSSRVFQREIVRQLRDALGCGNEVILLYDDEG